MSDEKITRIVAGGCSFTFGHELSDDQNGKVPSQKTWAPRLAKETGIEQYVCTAHPGAGNSGIARRVFKQITNNNPYNHKAISEVGAVVVMWSFNSRYDWAMPRHRDLEEKRWTSISPWDTSMRNEERHKALAGSEGQLEQWKLRLGMMEETGVAPFAYALYKHAANEYHETYLSWKSIIWLQNILEKKNIKYMFTLADNSLFYHEFDHHKDQDVFMKSLYNEIDMSKWFFFGERCMGFNQWATLEGYPYGTTHPLDDAHEDAVKLMLPTFKKIIGDQ